MARREQSFFEDLIEITSKLPWWVALVLALAAYLWLHGVASVEVTAVAQLGKMGAVVSQTFFKTLATAGQYLLPFAFLLGAAMEMHFGVVLSILLARARGDSGTESPGGTSFYHEIRIHHKWFFMVGIMGSQGIMQNKQGIMGSRENIGVTS